MNKDKDVYSLFCFVGLDSIVTNIYVGIADYIVHKMESYDYHLIKSDTGRDNVIGNKIVNELANEYPVDRAKLNEYIKRSIHCRKTVLSLDGFSQNLPTSTTYEELTGIDVNSRIIDQGYFDYYKKAYAVMSMNESINSMIISAVNAIR